MVKGGFQYDFSYRTSLATTFRPGLFWSRSKRPPRIEVRAQWRFFLQVRRETSRLCRSSSGEP